MVSLLVASLANPLFTETATLPLCMLEETLLQDVDIRESPPDDELGVLCKRLLCDSTLFDENRFAESDADALLEDGCDCSGGCC